MKFVSHKEYQVENSDLANGLFIVFLKYFI